MEHLRKEQTTATPTGLGNQGKRFTKVEPVIGNPLVQRIPISPVLIKPKSQDGVNTKIDYLIDKLSREEMEKDTEKKKKNWKFPFKWKRTMNKSLKSSSEDKVLCFFVNKKGELDPPVLLPIYNGNTLIYKYTIHEVDPRDIITLHQKKRSYKLLIYNITNRKPVSNRDYDDIKTKGNSTIDDEVFIKAMLTAKASQISKQRMGKGALIIGGLVIAGIIIWFFSKS